MKCPHCGLINPETAQRCDCGYDFQKGTIDRDKGVEVGNSSDSSYPVLFVLGLALGSSLGGVLIGGSVGVTIGLVVGGAIGKALQSIITSRRD